MQTKYAKYSEITKTEKEIARLVSLGFSNKKIAKIRNIAPSTVKTHIISVYQKLNIADNAKGNDGSKRVRLVLWYLKQQRKYKQELEMRKANEQESDEFWDGVFDKDYPFNKENVYKELADYYFFLQQIPKIYYEITGGTLSKTNYFASSVILAYRDNCERCQEKQEQEIKNFEKQLQEENAKLKQENEELKQKLLYAKNIARDILSHNGNIGYARQEVAKIIGRQQ